MILISIIKYTLQVCNPIKDCGTKATQSAEPDCLCQCSNTCASGEDPTPYVGQTSGCDCCVDVDSTFTCDTNTGLKKAEWADSTFTSCNCKCLQLLSCQPLSGLGEFNAETCKCQCSSASDCGANHVISTNPIFSDDCCQCKVCDNDNTVQTAFKSDLSGCVCCTCTGSKAASVNTDLNECECNCPTTECGDVNLTEFTEEACCQCKANPTTGSCGNNAIPKTTPAWPICCECLTTACTTGLQSNYLLDGTGCRCCDNEPECPLNQERYLTESGECGCRCPAGFNCNPLGVFSDSSPCCVCDPNNTDTTCGVNAKLAANPSWDTCCECDTTKCITGQLQLPFLAGSNNSCKCCPQCATNEESYYDTDTGDCGCRCPAQVDYCGTLAIRSDSSPCCECNKTDLTLCPTGHSIVNNWVSATEGCLCCKDTDGAAFSCETRKIPSQLISSDPDAHECECKCDPNAACGLNAEPDVTSTDCCKCTNTCPNGEPPGAWNADESKSCQCCSATAGFCTSNTTPATIPSQWTVDGSGCSCCPNEPVDKCSPYGFLNKQDCSCQCNSSKCGPFGNSITGGVFPNCCECADNKCGANAVQITGGIFPRCCKCDSSQSCGPFSQPIIGGVYPECCMCKRNIDCELGSVTKQWPQCCRCDDKVDCGPNAMLTGGAYPDCCKCKPDAEVDCSPVGKPSGSYPGCCTCDETKDCGPNSMHINDGTAGWPKCCTCKPDSEVQCEEGGKPGGISPNCCICQQTREDCGKNEIFTGQLPQCCKCKDRCNNGIDTPSKWKPLSQGCKCCDDIISCPGGMAVGNLPDGCKCVCTNKCRFGTPSEWQADGTGCKCCKESDCEKNSLPIANAVYPNCCKCKTITSSNNYCLPNGIFNDIAPICCKCNPNITCGDDAHPIEGSYPTCCECNDSCAFGVPYQNPSYPRCCQCAEKNSSQCGPNKVLGAYPECCKCANRCDNSNEKPVGPNCECCPDCPRGLEPTGTPPNCGCKCTNKCKNGDTPNPLENCKCCSNRDSKCDKPLIPYQYPQCGCPKCQNECPGGFNRDSCCCRRCAQCSVSSSNGYAQIPYDPPTCTCNVCTNYCKYGYLPSTCTCKEQCEVCPNGEIPDITLDPTCPCNCINGEKCKRGEEYHDNTCCCGKRSYGRNLVGEEDRLRSALNEMNDEREQLKFLDGEK